MSGTPAFAKAIYITRPLVPNRTTFASLVEAIFQSRWFTNDGVLVRQLEAQVRSRLGVGFCAAFCNGTSALQAALRALAVTGEVITTPFTFPATLHAIQWSGLTPVFCDVDPETYNLDAARARALLSPRTAVVLPVHVFGNPCDVVAFATLARDTGVRILYDAAHAFGVSALDRPIGSWGDLSVLSFHATKLFHTGEGGAVVGPDPGWQPRLALLRNFGILNEDEVVGTGVNGKLAELPAAVGLALLDGVDEEIRARAALRARYDERLRAVRGITFQRETAGTVSNHAYCAIKIDEEEFGLSRDELCLALRAENIMARKYFFPLCSDTPVYRDLPSAQPGRLPHAQRLASQVLCLPLYGTLTIDDIDRIADCVVAAQAAAPRVRDAIKAREP